MTPIQGVWVADDFFNELGLFRAAAVETIVSAPGIIPYFALFQNVALADVGDAECVIFYLPIQDRVNPHILCVRHFDNQFLNTVSVQIHEGVRKVFPIAEAIQNIRNIRRVGVRVGNKSIGLSKFHQRNPLYFLLWMGVHDASGFRFRDGLCVFGTAVQTSVPLVRLRIVDNTGQEFRAFRICPIVIVLAHPENFIRIHLKNAFFTRSKSPDTRPGGSVHVKIAVGFSVLHGKDIQAFNN